MVVTQQPRKLSHDCEADKSSVAATPQVARPPHKQFLDWKRDEISVVATTQIVGTSHRRQIKVQKGPSHTPLDYHKNGCTTARRMPDQEQPHHGLSDCHTNGCLISPLPRSGDYPTSGGKSPNLLEGKGNEPTELSNDGIQRLFGCSGKSLHPQLVLANDVGCSHTTGCSTVVQLLFEWKADESSVAGSPRVTRQLHRRLLDWRVDKSSEATKPHAARLPHNGCTTARQVPDQEQPHHRLSDCHTNGRLLFPLPRSGDYHASGGKSPNLLEGKGDELTELSHDETQRLLGNLGEVSASTTCTGR